MARTTTQHGGVGRARCAAGGWLPVIRRFGVRVGGPLAGALASLLLMGALASAPAWAGSGGVLSRLVPVTPIAFAAETSKAPKVLKQPLSTTVEEGQSATFEATASGSPTPTVQWEVSAHAGATWSPVAGGSADQLTVANAKTSESGDEYRAVFKNTAGEATSKAATLTVHEPPVVTQQPNAVTVEEGQGAAFEAAAAGAPSPTVQWERSTNGGSTWTNVTGATSDKLAIASAKTSENGQQFRATFKNVAGKATSEAATLTVRKAPVSPNSQRRRPSTKEPVRSSKRRRRASPRRPSSGKCPSMAARLGIPSRGKPLTG
jgi:hypothetical protein